MADAPVFRKAVTGPAVHALVIGVGRYPHLKGGGKPPTLHTEGMGQLTSAPASARAFASWLLSPDGLRDPRQRPIASIRLLLAEPSAKPFEARHLDLKAKPRPAIVQETDAAIAGWLADLDTDPDHLGLFFFSGHGVMAGVNQALLLSDFGVSAGNPFDAAIRFDQFYQGMSRAKAREQAYFIDACRSHSDALADTFGAGGRAFVTPDRTIQHARPRSAPIFNATLQGEQAYGLNNRPSLFTQALLDALRGAGSDNVEDDAVWTVETNTLGRGLDFLMEQAARRAGLGFAPVNAIDHASKLVLHQLPQPPMVPIRVLCNPDAPTAEFSWNLERWGLDQSAPFVPYGEQVFTARSPGPPPVVGEIRKLVRPPYGHVVIPVAKQP